MLVHNIEACALVGAQYGSEGKGLVAEKIANKFDVYIRTGAPNAGHTFYYDGKADLDEAFVLGAPDEVLQEGIAAEQSGRTRMKHVGRSVPCGWVNPKIQLLIGPGALVDLHLLHTEVDLIESYGYEIRNRLLVDEKAAVIDHRHHEFEGGVDGKAHRLIGSTGEGVGPARMARIARGTFGDRAWSHIEFVRDHPWLGDEGIQVGDTVEWLHSQKRRLRVLLEGTQGSGLSLIHGPWPYVTSSDTNAAQLCADAGISPHQLTSTILVARTFPIRVAGNSGPMAGEIEWDELGQPPEHTTVTKKQRRVGHWDDDLIRKAAQLNGPCRMIVTFLDYLFPEDAGVTEWENLSQEAHEFIFRIEDDHPDVMVVGCGTGPDTMAFHRASVIA